MAGKKTAKMSFVMYNDWETILGVLNDGELGTLMRAVFAYVNRGEQPGFDGALKVVFLMISQQLERDGEKWENICERNRHVAEKRWSDTDAKSTKSTKNTKSTKSTKNADTDTDTDNDTDTVIDTENDTENDTDIDTDTVIVTDNCGGCEDSGAPEITTSTTTTEEKQKSINDISCTPPTPGEVSAYCRERQNSVDAEYFCDYYAAKGWKIGKADMTDWRAAVRMWERKEKSSPVRADEQRSPQSTHSPKSTQDTQSTQSTQSSCSSDFDFDAYYAFAESYDPELILGQRK